mgnify:CR=1 FL=1
MSRLGVTGLFMALATTALLAQRTVTFEKLQVTDTVIGLAFATLNPPNAPGQAACEARAETAQMRYRFDGGTVGSTTGILFEVGDVLTLDHPADAGALRFVKTGSTTGVVQVQCWP